jgi:hypothetical protein
VAQKTFELLDESLKHDLPILYKVAEGVIEESEEAAAKLQRLLAKEVVDGLAFIPDPQAHRSNDISEALGTIRALRIAN